MFRNMIRFYGEELSAIRPIPKLEDHPLSALRDCLFSIFTTTFHIGGRSCIRNLRTRHAVVTGTHLSRLRSVFLTKYSYGYQFEKNEMGEACSTYGGEERCMQGLGGET